MTPDRLAAIHAASFTVPRPWDATEFAALLDGPGVVLLTESEGFLLGRVVADEAEILTLAVHPAARRSGLGRALVAAFLAEAQRRGARRAFLEVAAVNTAALALYRSAGFIESGRRKGYFTSADRTRFDARVLSRAVGEDT